MRWPFGPPHLTLKQNKKTSKKTTKKKIKNKKQKHTNIPQKEFFSCQSNFTFSVGVQNFPFLTTWPKTRAPPKNYKHRGFREQIFEKQLCVTKLPFLDPKNPNPEIPVIFFCPFSSLSTTKNTKMLWNPYFYSVLASQEKRFFKKSSQNTEDWKTQFLHPFFEKGYF